MSARTRMTLEGSKEEHIIVSNDRRTIDLLAKRFGPVPLTVTLSPPEAEALMSEIHDALTKVASSVCDSDDVDAMSWTNSLWTMSSLIVGLSRVSPNGRYTSAVIRVG